ncbi:MAG: DUF885 domain-containing protein [Nitriliruptoraceae bacterium]
MEQLQRRADELVLRFLRHIREHEPVEGSRLGLAGVDGRLPDLAPPALEARARDLQRLARAVAVELAALEGTSGTGVREARGDLLLLAAELDHRRFLREVRPRLALDPLTALDTVGAGIHGLLSWDDGTPGDRCRRLEAAAQRARRVPVLLEQASGLLTSAPEPHLRMALERVSGLVRLVREVLPGRAEELGVDVSPARDAGEVAAEGLEAFAALLDELTADPPGAWRLGPEDHALVLRTALGTTMWPSQIEDRARVHLVRTRARLAELTGAHWSHWYPRERPPRDEDERIRRALAALARTALRPQQLLDEARLAIEEARAFSRSSALIDLPPSERLRVREVPPHLSGVAVAYVTPPPPLRPATGCTYHLAPIPAGWERERAGGLLQAYTPAALRSLAIHEGYPGHVVQLEHAAQHPRLARRLLARPVFAEGWAVYIEREVTRAGFGLGESSRVPAPDHRLVHLVHELRIATSALVDVGLHAASLPDTAAYDLLLRAAFHTPEEAAATVRRAQVLPGQLSTYFVGGEELTDLRSEVELREGSAFQARTFHQRVLSHGTPTVRIVAEALADEAPTLRPFAVPV